VRRHFETRASDDEEIAPSATDRRLPLAILEHRVWRGRRYAHAAAALRPALLLGAVRPCACAGVSGAKERTAATDRWIKDVTTHGHPILRQMHARGSRSEQQCCVLSAARLKSEKQKPCFPAACSLQLEATVPSAAGDLSPYSSSSSPRLRYAESTHYGLLLL
jgi:hypothetical protein